MWYWTAFARKLASAAEARRDSALPQKEADSFPSLISLSACPVPVLWPSKESMEPL